MASFTSAEDLGRSYTTLFKTFASGKTKDLAWRKWQLKQCWWLLEDNESLILDALKADLNRHPFEAFVADILGLKADLMDHIEHLEEWAADVRPDAGFLLGTLGKARIRKQPLGVTLIIGAWNFPFLLLMQPMVAAITAGCCIMLKPSELAEHTQNLLSKLVPQYLDPSAIRLVTGGPAETGRILEHRFDHIFFTGSSKVARYITAAAAKHLTPVVLELGGQGPAIVAKTADLDFAAKRIAYAKFFNGGQICLTVNHVFAEPEIYDAFVERLSYWTEKFAKASGDDMTRIINERNWDRLSNMLSATKGKIASGGERDRASKYIQPTVVRDVTLSDSLMTEELFGPIAPVIEADIATAVASINSLGHPLALYIFSNDAAVTNHIIANTISGGVTINSVIMHASLHNTPFGGVGESGYGAYHGRHGFDCFSHSRAIVEPPRFLDKLMGFMYPPLNFKNTSKLAVKNKFGFKRGEGIKDQRIGGHGRLIRSMRLVVIALVCLGFFASLTAGAGERTGLLGALLAPLIKLQKQLGLRA